MKITLIKPTIGSKTQKLYIDEGRMEPLQLGVLAGMIPKDIEVRLFDDRMERIDYDDPTDLVMITVETYTAKRAYEIAQNYRSLGVKVAMGGMHVNLLPEEVKDHCDCMLFGDGETIFEEVIADFRENKMKNAYYGSLANPPQENIIPRRELYKDKGYLPLYLTQFSRGCIHNCNYCAVSKYFKRTHSTRDIKQVVQELKEVNRRYVFFVDDNLIANKEQAKELFRAITPLNIRWVSQGSLDMLQDEELMELAMKSGAMGYVMGFESINEASLDYMGKPINKIGGFDKYSSAVEKLRNYGLQTWAAFTIGHDTDTIDIIKATVDFALESKFTFAAFNVLMPYPNTPLYHQLKEENRLLYDGKWWLHDDYRFNHAAFIPKLMTPDELTEIGFYCRKKFNSPLNVIKRSLDPKTNLASFERFLMYWFYNPIFVKEVYKKQDMIFGLKHMKKDELQRL